MHRFNSEGPDGLTNRTAPRATPKLSKAQRAQLAALVGRDPIPAADGVVRRRACDLQQLIHEKFAISVSDDTVYRMLHALGYAHVSAQPKAYRQNDAALGAFKKTSAHGWWRSARTSRPATPSRSGFRTR